MGYKATTKLKINLSDVFNKTFQDRKVRNALRPVISKSDFKRQFGQAVVDQIVSRTQDSGVDKNGNKFNAYSKSYRTSDQFKIYGKGSKVNLTLTGEMLSSMRSVNNNETFITIEFDNELDAAKATGHITGNLGGNYSIKFIRDFFGLPDKELISIMKDEMRLYRNTTLDQLADSGLPSLNVILGIGDDT